MSTHIYTQEEMQKIVCLTIKLLQENSMDIDNINDDNIVFVVNELMEKLNKRNLLFD
jgi:hypothetical protein